MRSIWGCQVQQRPYRQRPHGRHLPARSGHANTRPRRRPELPLCHHSQDRHPGRGHLESLRTW